MSDNRNVSQFMSRVHMLKTELDGMLENVLDENAELARLFVQLDIVEQEISTLSTIHWDVAHYARNDALLKALLRRDKEA
jgi:sulfur relay (sulfurtransferase) DsrC/TusE family protein